MKVPESFVLKFHVVCELLDGRLLLYCQVLDARSADLLNVGAFPGACQLCLINSDLLHDHAVYNLLFPIVRSKTKSHYVGLAVTKLKICCAACFVSSGGSVEVTS